MDKIELTRYIDGDQKDLLECIGYDSFVKLCEMYGGNMIYVSKIENINRDARNEKIFADYNNNIPLKTIAKKYNLTEVWIRNIIKENF